MQNREPRRAPRITATSIWNAYSHSGGDFARSARSPRCVAGPPWDRCHCGFNKVSCEIGRRGVLPGSPQNRFGTLIPTVAAIRRRFGGHLGAFLAPRGIAATVVLKAFRAKWSVAALSPQRRKMHLAQLFPQWQPNGEVQEVVLARSWRPAESLPLWF